MTTLPSVEDLTMEAIHSVLAQQANQLEQARQQIEVGRETWSLQSRQLAEKVEDIASRLMELENRGLTTPWPSGLGGDMSSRIVPDSMHYAEVEQLKIRIEEMENKIIQSIRSLSFSLLVLFFGDLSLGGFKKESLLEVTW